MNLKLKNKLAKLPASPGVYFFKDKRPQIIYVGKAANLKKRLKQYWQKKYQDSKTKKLIDKVFDLDFIITDSEFQALFLEAELIKRYKPLFNLREKDDKNFLYLRVSTQEDFPVVSFVRRPLDDKSQYFGPFVSAQMLRQAMKYLRRIFPYITSKRWPKVSLLEHQIGLSPHPEISKQDYRRTIRKLLMVLRGKKDKLIKDLEIKMRALAANRNYEQAAQLRDQIAALKSLDQKVFFDFNKQSNLTVDPALSGLVSKLNLAYLPTRIEAYDVSNFGGSHAVSSMVVFTNGVADYKEYRHFKMHTKGPDDYGMIRETVYRRFTKNLDWPLPDLILIDGGKGQLSSALQVLGDLGIHIPTIGLVKGEEKIIQFGPQGFKSIVLPKTSAEVKLLQRIRDEAHRFAITYYRNLTSRAIRASQLTKIPGIGPVSQQKLIKHFGSLSKIKQAKKAELKALVGAKKAQIIKQQLR